MDLGDVAVLATNAKKVAKKTVNNSAIENRQSLARTFERAASKGVKVMEKSELGSTVLDGGKLVGKTASKGLKIVEKTQIGGAVLDGAGMVGGAALNLATDGAGLVGGTMAMGVSIVGKTAMMGQELIGEGMNLFSKDDGSAFFHEEDEELEGYDNDFDGDELMPERFHNPEKERKVRPSMIVQWDNLSWSELDGGLSGHNPDVVVDKTVSQRMLEIQKEEELGEQNKEEEDELESVESHNTEDIYFTDTELKAKKKNERRERKRLRKERKRMSKIEREQAEMMEAKAKKKAQAEYDNIGAFGQSFSGLVRSIAMATNPDEVPAEISAPTGVQLPKPPVQSLSMMGRQTSEGSIMDDFQKKRRSKGLWTKVRANVTTRAVVKEFQRSVERSNSFHSLYDDNDEVDKLDDPRGAATAMLEIEHSSEKDKVQKLRKQLDDYETNLEKDRKQIEEERKRIAVEKTELESQFKIESERNEQFTKEFQKLKEELDVEIEKKNGKKVQRKLEGLRAENEVLKDQVEKQDAILRQLHREKAIREKRAKREDLNYEADTRRSSASTIKSFLSSDTNTVFLEDESTVVTYVAKSRRSSNIKVMGDNLEEMHDELEARQKVIEMQNSELEDLQNQLREAEDCSGVKPLQDEYLELKKQTEEVIAQSNREKEGLAMILEAKKEVAAQHAAEISRLKLEQTKKELKAAQKQEPPEEKGGLFGMLWGDTKDTRETTSDADVALSKLGL